MPPADDCGLCVRAPRGPRMRVVSLEPERERLAPPPPLPFEDVVGERERAAPREGDVVPRGVGGDTTTGALGASAGTAGAAASAVAGVDSSTSGGGVAKRGGMGGWSSSFSGGGSAKVGIGGGVNSSSFSGGGSLNAGGIGGASSAGAGAGSASASRVDAVTGVLGVGAWRDTGGTSNVAVCGASAFNSAGTGGTGGAGLGALEGIRMPGFFAASCASRISWGSIATESRLLLTRMSIGAVRFRVGILRSDSRFFR